MIRQHSIGVQLANNNSYGNLAKTYWENEQKPIFVVRESDEEPIYAVVKVEYNDKWYSIPHSDQLNRTEISTSTLTFVKQVMGLNTSKKAVGSNTSVVTGVVVQSYRHIIFHTSKNPKRWNQKITGDLLTYNSSIY